MCTPMKCKLNFAIKYKYLWVLGIAQQSGVRIWSSDRWEAYNYGKTFTVWPIIIAYSRWNWGTKTSHVNRCLFFIFLSLSPPDMKHRKITICFQLAAGRCSGLVFQARNQILVKTKCAVIWLCWLWVLCLSLVFKKHLHVRLWSSTNIPDVLVFMMVMWVRVWPAICPLFSRYIKICPLYLSKDVKHRK